MTEEFEEVMLDFEDPEPGESPTGVLNADGSPLGGGGGGATYFNNTGMPPTFPVIGSDSALLEEEGMFRDQHPMSDIGSGNPDGLA